MEEFDGKTFSQKGKQRKHIFPNRENGENHFLINFVMFLNSIYIKRKELAKTWENGGILLKKNLVKWKTGKTHVHKFAKKRSIF